MKTFSDEMTETLRQIDMREMRAEVDVMAETLRRIADGLRVETMRKLAQKEK